MYFHDSKRTFVYSLQNPAVQNMMQNDPRLNNPQMRQAMDSLASNPEMLNQVSSMMRDPAMQAQMQQMMQQGGMPGMNMPAGMGGPPTPQVPNNTNASGASQPNNNNNSGENDEEMTEEEMIAEAIRRSLGEN